MYAGREERERYLGQMIDLSQIHPSERESRREKKLNSSVGDGRGERERERRVYLYIGVGVEPLGQCHAPNGIWFGRENLKKLKIFFYFFIFFNH